MKKKLKKEIEKGYEDILAADGREYLRLPKRERENLIKRYRAIEGATIEYLRENKGKQRLRKKEK